MSERFWLLESAEEKRVQGYTGRPAHMEKEGWTILAELPKTLANERPDDLIISTTTDDDGFETVTVAIDEQKKSERLARENSERQAREQKKTLREQRKKAEVEKLKGAKPTTLPEALKLLDAIAKIVLSDKGEIDLAEDEESDTQDSKGRP